MLSPTTSPPYYPNENELNRKTNSFYECESKSTYKYVEPIDRGKPTWCPKWLWRIRPDDFSCDDWIWVCRQIEMADGNQLAADALVTGDTIPRPMPKAPSPIKTKPR